MLFKVGLEVFEYKYNYLNMFFSFFLFEYSFKYLKNISIRTRNGSFLKFFILVAE